MVAPLVFTIATFEIVLAEKTFGRKTLKVHLAITFS